MRHARVIRPPVLARFVTYAILPVPVLALAVQHVFYRRPLQAGQEYVRGLPLGDVVDLRPQHRDDPIRLFLSGDRLPRVEKEMRRRGNLRPQQ